MERLHDLGLVYRSEANPIVQEAWFLGRYHGQYHWSEGNRAQGEGWENRRFRIGGHVRLFEKLVVHAQMVSKEDLSEFYGGFTELWVGWRFSDAIMLTIGQQKHRFTHDRNISSRYLNTLERSQLTNMFGLDYTPAITLTGRKGRWGYYGGAFTNATGTDIGSAFVDFDSGGSFLAIATYDLREWIPIDSAFLNGGYLYSHATRRATNLNRFNHGVASALILTEGPLSLVTEVTAGFGSEPGDAAGLNVQPGWYIMDELQLVGRYQLAGSSGEEGLIAQRRYEREAGMSTGELYQAGYLGLNYYILGHRLKLMSGIEYATLGGDHVWTGSLAVRLFWGPDSSGPFPMAQQLEGTWD
ncbi:OprO/OprP family phosphate-selective porin [Myxococcota bacterium]|nr:OprO/OprP family phosphate-selective porin [Myxococcota bacterium]